MRITVTLARQLGCGGSVIGQRLAEILDVRCLDREIISRAAQQLDCAEADLAEREERRSSFWERMLRGLVINPPEALYVPPPSSGPVISDEALFAAETEVMREIAAQEDCVIVGRAAGHVLAPHPGLVNAFLYAPLDFRVQRLIDHHQIPDKAQARALIVQSDGTREKIIARMTNRTWDDATNYHLCIDTSSLPLEDLTQFLADYVRRVQSRNGEAVQ